jgi:hypothetical protein
VVPTDDVAVDFTVEAVTRLRVSYWNVSVIAWMLSVRESKFPSVSN